MPLNEKIHEVLIGDSLHTLTGNIYTIGRSALCDIQIKKDNSLSRIHCTIAKGTNDSYQIMDGNTLPSKPSSNGTRVNGIELNIDYAQELRDGDEIELSPLTKIRFFSRSKEATVDADSTLL